MTPEAARDALVTAVKAALDGSLPTLKAYYENGPTPNLDTVGDSLVNVVIDFNAAQQASIERQPMTRITGEMCLTHLQKQGQGTKAMLARVDTLNAALKHKNFSGVQTATPYPGRKEGHDGWYSQEWCIPFWFHQQN